MQRRGTVAARQARDAGGDYSVVAVGGLRQ